MSSDTNTQLDSILRKIELLFSKSESSEFPEEASALQAKAQELMIKYQIEEAQLTGRTKQEALGSLKVLINSPFVVDKSLLLHVVAKNNYCQTLRGRNYATLYGYPSDMELVATMYRGYLIHMISEMYSELKSKPSWESTTSWKKSFFSGYANRLNVRLSEVNRDQIKNVTAATGDNKFTLVLIDKQKEIDLYFEGIPKGHGSPRSLSSTAGYSSGREAANRADLGQTRISARKSLSS